MSDPSRTGMIAREAVSQRVLVVVDSLSPSPCPTWKGRGNFTFSGHADVSIVNGCPQWVHVGILASQLFSRKLAGCGEISAGF